MNATSYSRPPRLLKEHEVARVVAAGRRLGYPFGTLAEVMALTGGPPRAARFMRWTDINREEAVWTPRAQKDEPAPPESLPLVPDVLKLLDAVPVQDHTYVFAGPTGKACADNARKRAVIAKAAGLDNFEFADVWHTLQSDLNHPEQRETLENWASLILSMIAPPNQPDTETSPPADKAQPEPARD